MTDEVRRALEWADAWKKDGPIANAEVYALVLATAYRTLLTRAEAAEKEIESHHKETEQVCGYKKLIDCEAKLNAKTAECEAMKEELESITPDEGRELSVAEAIEAHRRWANGLEGAARIALDKRDAAESTAKALKAENEALRVKHDGMREALKAEVEKAKDGLARIYSGLDCRYCGGTGKCQPATGKP